ncbi:PAS domain S-box protein [Rhizobium sp. P40RR-XXII]|uniref:PAS domain S-box protein n=1 Tax=Rhizobium sp. P40RR-XXII TaxID=2726739 RepID=UPI00197E2741|nr:PAS domain S-box protein [Rhizobium sp. P40RR-XXII]
MREEAPHLLQSIDLQRETAPNSSSRATAVTSGEPSGTDAPPAQALLAAIVESSDDAIVSKSLTGHITSWNRSAERLFGYAAVEAIGQHISIIIPDDRLHEEDVIISSIRAGKRIEHYETVRRRKDGTLLDISLTVSPVRDSHGTIVGASKVARDISERKRAAERQVLLLREMNHRIKNIFAIVSAVIGLSERTATTVHELARDVRARTNALAIAHELTLQDIGPTTFQSQQTTLFALMKALFAAHQIDGVERVSIDGEDIPVRGNMLTPLALLLHEFSTNATKYGALSTPDGRIEIDVRHDTDFSLVWTEIGGPAVYRPDGQGGFGSQLEKATIGSLQGSIEREWDPTGLKISLRIPATILRGEQR